MGKMADKGVVCGVKSRSLVVLTPDFDFVEIRKRPGLTVGQEVPFAADELVLHRRPTRLLALAASFVVLALISFLALPRFAPHQPLYAYVEVEVNPGIELAVNQSLLVAGVAALNVDGAEVIGSLDLEGRPVAEAVTAIVRAYRVRGYLDSGTRYLMVTTTFLDNEPDTALQAALLETVEAELVEVQSRTEIFVLESNTETRQRAREKALSTADLMIREGARRDGVLAEGENVPPGKLAETLTEKGRDFGAAASAAAKMRGRAVQDSEPAPPAISGDGGKDQRPTPPGLDKKNGKDDGVSSGKPLSKPGVSAPPVRPLIPEDTEGDQDDSLPAPARGAGQPDRAKNKVPGPLQEINPDGTEPPGKAGPRGRRGGDDASKENAVVPPKR